MLPLSLIVLLLPPLVSVWSVPYVTSRGVWYARGEVSVFIFIAYSIVEIIETLEPAIESGWPHVNADIVEAALTR